MKTKRLIIRSIGSLFIVILFIFAWVQSAEAAVIKLKVKPIVETNLPNIRLEPAVTSRIIMQAPQGAILESDEKRGAWYKVALASFGGDIKYGFIHQSVVDIIEVLKEELKEERVAPEKETKDEKTAITPYQQAPTPAIPEMKTVPTRDQSGFRIAHIGGKIGLNFANIDGEGVEDINIDEQGAITGLCFGGFITIKFSKYFGVQPEILISSKGAIDTLDYETQKTRLVLTYLEFPLLAKLFIPVGDILEPNIFIGPYFSMLLGNNYSRFGESMRVDGIKSSDFGLVFGAGIDVLKKASKIGNLHLDVRYSLGLSSIYDSEHHGESKNSAINFMLGYSF